MKKLLQREHASSLIDSNNTYTEDLLSQALTTLIEKSSQLLSKKYAEVFILYAKGWSIARIAEILDLPQGTVKSRISRAKQGLQKNENWKLVRSVLT